MEVFEEVDHVDADLANGFEGECFPTFVQILFESLAKWLHHNERMACGRVL